MTDRFEAVFVEDIPEVLERGRLYVSVEHATALHLCACGCGSEIVTPLGPTDWRLTFDGKVSLSPSVGNWALACKSHYWITRERVEWAGMWDDEQIDRGRERDRRAKQLFYGDDEIPSVAAIQPAPAVSWWRRLRSLVVGEGRRRDGKS